MPSIAQRLRKNPTTAEIRFWRLIAPLRTRFHFRKQVAMGRYVVDFASHSARLVVEIDGDTHFSEAAMAQDRQREADLVRHGYRVLRFANAEVMNNPEGVYRVVMQALEESIPPPERR